MNALSISLGTMFACFVMFLVTIPECSQCKKRLRIKQLTMTKYCRECGSNEISYNGEDGCAHWTFLIIACMSAFFALGYVIFGWR